MEGVGRVLSFEEKRAVFLSFNLEEKPISNGRVSFVYPESKQKGQVLATQLHPSGNGYVIGKYMTEETIRKNKFQLDRRGWITIRDYSKDELEKVITEALKSMSGVDQAAVTQPEKQAVLKNDHSCLHNWVNFNVSMMELGFLVWKRTLKSILR